MTKTKREPLSLLVEGSPTVEGLPSCVLRWVALTLTSAAYLALVCVIGCGDLVIYKVERSALCEKCGGVAQTQPAGTRPSAERVDDLVRSLLEN